MTELLPSLAYKPTMLAAVVGISGGVCTINSGQGILSVSYNGIGDYLVTVDNPDGVLRPLAIIGSLTPGITLTPDSFGIDTMHVAAQNVDGDPVDPDGFTIFCFLVPV